MDSYAEKRVEGIYERMSKNLYFNASNFQQHARNFQGTNFILLHFWFHTLIVLLHQPTLLHSFEGSIQKLFPNSRELAMSSAKTIADIFTFAELMDCRSFVGNPFTSQPIYIAACAFLLEGADHMSAASRPHSPVEPTKSPSELESPSSLEREREAGVVRQLDLAQDSASVVSGQVQVRSAKHTLLAAAAHRDYQRCYKGLKLLERYWAGARYILTVLDQKSKGVLDPLLYKIEDLTNMVQNSDSKIGGGSPTSRPSTANRPASTASAASFLVNLMKPGNYSEEENPSKLDPSQGKIVEHSIQHLQPMADGYSFRLVPDRNEQ